MRTKCSSSSRRKAIYEKVFADQEHKYFTNILGEVVNKLKKIENRTPATDDFIRHLEMFPGKVREMQTKLSDAYKNAVVQNALESAKGKLVTAAHEGGMATGTSGELPAGMLDKLGKFLAEDPFGAAEKIDKFCTYLENDGDVAMKLDRSGIEKANWGGFFRNLFCKVRKVPSNPGENAQIRQALLMAIGNSSEGKVLTEEQMQQIYSAIGMPAGVDAANNSARLESPLTRRELKNIIDIIDSAVEALRNSGDMLAKVSEE